MSEEKKLPVSVVAKRLGVSVSTVYRLGRIPLSDGGLVLLRTGVSKGYKVLESSVSQHLEKRMCEAA